MNPFPARLSIALSDHQVWIHARSLFGSQAVHTAVIPRPGAEWPALSEVLREYLAQHEIETRAADVRILPPLAIARVLELPRLTHEEIQLVVERSPERYFPIGHAPHLVATRRLTYARGKPARVLAAAVSRTNVDAIRKALADAGVDVRSIACAHDVWLGAARSPHARLVIAANGGTVDVLELTHGELRNVRRVAPGALSNYALEPNGSRPSVVVISDESGQVALPAGDGYSVTNNNVSPGEYCARQRGSGQLILRDAAGRTAAVARGWRVAAFRSLMAALLLVSAAVLETRHQRTELAAIRVARAQLRPQLTTAIGVKHGAEQSAAELANLQELERRSERWSLMLTGVARHLPLDARLLSMRINGDTVILEGVSHDPQLSFTTLRESGLLQSLDVTNPVTSERNSDGESSLRFRFQGHVRPVGGP